MKVHRILEQTVSVCIGIAIAGTAYVVAAPGDLVPVGRIIPYEGYVAADGVPLNATRTMCFRLYDGAGAASPFWESGPVSVPIAQGTFAVNLGSGAVRLTEQAFSTPSLHLGVELASGASCSVDRRGELAGRQQLVNPWLATNGPGFIRGGSLQVDTDVVVGRDVTAAGNISAQGSVRVASDVSTTAGDVVVATEAAVLAGMRSQYTTGTGGNLLLGRAAQTIADGSRVGAGIYWPRNLFGGADDFAFIRMQAGATGDDQRLVIQAGNDAGDGIYLDAPRVAIANLVRISTNCYYTGGWNYCNCASGEIAIGGGADCGGTVRYMAGSANNFASDASQWRIRCEQDDSGVEASSRLHAVCLRTSP